MTAELSARRTAAAALLADYVNSPGSADPSALSLWAARLASMLGLVLDVLEAPAGGDDVAQLAGVITRAGLDAAKLAQVRIVLDAFDLLTDDPHYALEQINDIVNGDPT